MVIGLDITWIQSLTPHYIWIKILLVNSAISNQDAKRSMDYINHQTLQMVSFFCSLYVFAVYIKVIDNETSVFLYSQGLKWN